LAEHGGELFAAARNHRTGLFFEASVAGGIPIIRSLQEGLVANELDSIVGILNGTCNYILTRMEESALSFDAALQEAQAAGYAEADPALDIDGLDTAHKACILASIAYGSAVKPSQLHVRGIRGLEQIDILCAAELGYHIKMLASLRRVKDQAEIAVQPALVPGDHVLAGVSGVYNAVLVEGDLSGRTLYYGRGAGRYPTASAILGDLADAAGRLLTSGPWNTSGFAPGEGRTRLKDPDAARARYYLRLSLLDRPGILARVAQTLGGHGISLASVLQREQEADGIVPVIMLTHSAPGRSVRAALREIDAMDCVGGPTVRFRIEDFADETTRSPRPINWIACAGARRKE
ncbi:MAG: homoserine dehydrogenase, partial [Kiritimatiellia bacterium]|nr:homoserine dehydrogenase [Kiritimatiellia bacterium]